MVSDMEVHMKHRCGTKFLYVEKMAPIDIHGWLLNIYGDPTVDVITVRWWVMHFSNADNSESPSMVHIFTSTACRLLFIARENAQLMVVTVLIVVYRP